MILPSALWNSSLSNGHIVGVVTLLLSFTFENWKSFRDEANFSMVAGRDRQFAQRLPRAEKMAIRLLPVSLVYGGNAAGKSNFFEALHFAKSFVVDGNKPDSPIAVTPFRLDKNCEKLPSKFSFQILCDEKVFRFSFTVNRQHVLEEQLTEVNKSSEKDLYIRYKDGTIWMEKSTTADAEDEQFVEFVKRATPRNQLFLTRSIVLNFQKFRPVFEWFRDRLELVHSNSSVIMPRGSSVEAHMIQHIIPQLDTGIDKIGLEKVKIRDLNFPKWIVADLQEKLKVKNSKAFIQAQGGDRANYYNVERKNGRLVCHRWVTYHKRQDGAEVKFEFDEESAGTARIFDLLPVLATIFSKDSKKVYVIDEIDRSLHTLLTRELIENYLLLCNEKTRCQLVFTTHDLMLLNRYIFRRDEVWLTERDRDGSSSLFSMYDFKKSKPDKDVRRAYLTGRFGGTPKLDLNIFSSSEGNSSNE